MGRLLACQVGAWRSLVAHTLGVGVVGGSNPLAPTNLRLEQGGERRLPRRSRQAKAGKMGYDIAKLRLGTPLSHDEFLLRLHFTV